MWKLGAYGTSVCISISCAQFPGSAPTWFTGLHLIVFSARPQQKLWCRWPDDMMIDSRFQSSQQHTYILGGWLPSRVCLSVSVCGLCIIMNVREEGKQMETSHSRLCFSLALLTIKVKLDRQRSWPAPVLSPLCGVYMKHLNLNWHLICCRVWNFLSFGVTCTHKNFNSHTIFLHQLTHKKLHPTCASSYNSNLGPGICTDPVIHKEYSISPSVSYSCQRPVTLESLWSITWAWARAQFQIGTLLASSSCLEECVEEEEGAKSRWNSGMMSPLRSCRGAISLREAVCSYMSFGKHNSHYPSEVVLYNRVWASSELSVTCKGRNAEKKKWSCAGQSYSHYFKEVWHWMGRGHKYIALNGFNSEVLGGWVC